MKTMQDLIDIWVARGRSKTDLAQALGVAKQTISRWTKGDNCLHSYYSRLAELIEKQ